MLHFDNAVCCLVCKNDQILEVLRPTADAINEVGDGAKLQFVRCRDRLDRTLDCTVCATCPQNRMFCCTCFLHFSFRLLMF